MARDTYVVNTQKDDSGVHEVHVRTCEHLPYSHHQAPLGLHTDCGSAVAAASAGPWRPADGCKWCCAPCHTR